MTMTETGGKNIVKDMCKLSSREKEILQLSAHGVPNKEIADIYCIRVTTVKAHFSNIRRKLDGQNKSPCRFSFLVLQWNSDSQLW